MKVQIEEKTIQGLKELFPARLAASMNVKDIEYFTDFMATIGIEVIKSLLKSNPGLTFGDIITRYRSH
jgi:hypothetical protein